MLTKLVLQSYRARIGALAVVTVSAAFALALGLTGAWLFGVFAAASVAAAILMTLTWWSTGRSGLRLRRTPNTMLSSPMRVVRQLVEALSAGDVIGAETWVGRRFTATLVDGTTATSLRQLADRLGPFGPHANSIEIFSADRPNRKPHLPRRRQAVFVWVRIVGRTGTRAEGWTFAVRSGEIRSIVATAG